MRPDRALLICILISALAAAGFTPLAADPPAPEEPEESAAPRVPRLVGSSWKVAGDPDLGALASPRQQPVDFAIWQAGDGTWQLWSCIRGTLCGGQTRLLYRWEGRSLLEPDWTPRGIAQEARPELGETPGGQQAPHVVKHGGIWWMAYGDWEHICLSKSRDGKRFTRVVLPSGRTGLFSEGCGTNTRDPMLLRVAERWHCYYTAFPERQGAVFLRTSADLLHWSPSVTVAFGGRSGTGATSAECPHVVRRHDRYYLLRTQRYGRDMQTSVYCSSDPAMFGINQDARYFLTTLPVAAPEIVRYEGRDYIAYLEPELKGILVSRLQWRLTPRGPRWDTPRAPSRRAREGAPLPRRA